MKKLLFILSIITLTTSTSLSALILIDDVMSRSEQEKMGIDKLTRRERYALEQWLNKNFTKKPEQEIAYGKKTLYVSEIINSGQQIKLSDESLYEVAPDDWGRAQAWINVANVEVAYTGDPYYPWTITNPLSGYSIKARLIDTPNPLERQQS